MRARAARGLLLSCHPLPCLAVTGFVVAYGAVIGGRPGRLLAIAAAVLAGQLCVGWSNDAIDGWADRAAGRPDKPIATGMIGRRAVALASGAAGIVCVVLSLRLGRAAGLLHLAAVASALAYNAGLKSTLASAVPYLFSFGLLPVVTTLAVRGSGSPPAQQVAAAVLFGAAAHFGNTVDDADADAATGVRGLPQRIGARRSMVVMALLVVAAAVILLVGILTAGGLGPARRAGALALLGAGTLVALAGAVMRAGAWTRAGGPPDAGGRSAWHLTLVSVGLVVAGFLLGA